MTYTDTDNLDPRSHRGNPPVAAGDSLPQLTCSQPRPRSPTRLQVAGCGGGGGAHNLRGRVSASASAAPTCQHPVHSPFVLLLAPPATIRPSPLNPWPFPLERDHGGAGIPRHVEGGLRGAGRAHGGHAGVHLGHRRLAVPPGAAYAVSTASVLACGLVGSYCDFVEMCVGESCGLWNLSVR